ncbi:BON1-associated protein 2-like [Camellia sinensis]|nr:BON1-associated protein 2-like [Camellia sinensis]
MATTTPRSLEVTVISGEGLRIGRRWPLKKNCVFVVIQTDSQTVRMTTDTESGTHPTWNEKLVVDMPVSGMHFVTVEVHCKTYYSGDKIIGTARIPVTDFTGGYVPENCLQFLSYRLWNRRGEKNGIINLSVRVKVPETAISGGSCAAVASYSRRWTGGPVAEKDFGGIVTGVPVRYRH